MRQIALLRGINIGARNRVAMPALRELLADAGCKDVSTYLQSGNAVLTSRLSPQRLAGRCERQIAERLGLEIAVVVRTRDELAEVVRDDPFGELAADPKRYQVSFCSDEPDQTAVRRLAERAAGAERMVARGREIYTWLPDGVGRSRLATALARQDLGVVATARNWTTVNALLALAEK